jgi:hypothetical protein
MTPTGEKAKRLFRRFFYKTRRQNSNLLGLHTPKHTQAVAVGIHDFFKPYLCFVYA